MCRENDELHPCLSIILPDCFNGQHTFFTKALNKDNFYGKPGSSFYSIFLGLRYSIHVTLMVKTYCD